MDFADAGVPFMLHWSICLRLAYHTLVDLPVHEFGCSSLFLSKQRDSDKEHQHKWKLLCSASSGVDAFESPTIPRDAKWLIQMEGQEWGSAVFAPEFASAAGGG
ncbi:hypothetical protein R1sor_000010 [Riccia sorocarpa]|uniref:Uncharacterized protein n=1 Tax=Riccia sorocarpa TaxID=122646 RepID=A0ABD3GS51_9MARC